MAQCLAHPRLVCCFKSRYKYEVRHLKRRKEHIRRMKMAKALTRSNLSEFWHQIRAVTKKSSTSSMPSVDGAHGPSNISQLFSSKLQSILNSGSSDARDALLVFINSSVTHSDIDCISDCVAEAFSHSKRGKSDDSNLPSDHFLSAAPAVTSF